MCLKLHIYFHGIWFFCSTLFFFLFFIHYHYSVYSFTSFVCLFSSLLPLVPLILLFTFILPASQGTWSNGKFYFHFSEVKINSEKLSNFLIVNESKTVTQVSITVLTKCKILLKFHFFFTLTIFLSLYTVLALTYNLLRSFPGVIRNWLLNMEGRETKGKTIPGW